MLDHQRWQLQSLKCKAKIYKVLLGELTSQATLTENISIRNGFNVCHPTPAQISLANSSIEPVHSGILLSDAFSDFLSAKSLGKHHIPMPSSRISSGHYAARLNNLDLMEIPEPIPSQEPCFPTKPSYHPPMQERDCPQCERDRLLRLGIGPAIRNDDGQPPNISKASQSEII